VAGAAGVPGTLLATGSAALAAAGLCLGLCLRRGVFAFPAGRELKWWRIIARPFALLLVPIDRIFGRTPLLFKRTEVKRFSSMTGFLVAIFLVFPDHVPAWAWAS
jgi:hypothetical protein